MDVYLNTEDVAAGSLTKTVTHNLNNVSAVVARVLANWLTDISVTGRTANDVTLAFNAQAPVGGGQIDIRIIA